MLGKGGLRRMSTKLLRRLVRHLRPANIGRSFETFGSKHEMCLKPSSSIASEIILDLWILKGP